ncbi:HTH DNA binding protein [Acinetobacter phage EAb13]|nr:HTH DNA binding protein [Acinetobacter phage EAb13]
MEQNMIPVIGRTTEILTYEQVMELVQNIRVDRPVITHKEIADMVASGEGDLLMKCFVAVRDALIEEALIHTRGELQKAAAIMGVTRNTLNIYRASKGKPHRMKFK